MWRYPTCQLIKCNLFQEGTCTPTSLCQHAATANHCRQERYSPGNLSTTCRCPRIFASLFPPWWCRSQTSLQVQENAKIQTVYPNNFWVWQLCWTSDFFWNWERVMNKYEKSTTLQRVNESKKTQCHPLSQDGEIIALDTKKRGNKKDYSRAVVHWNATFPLGVNAVSFLRPMWKENSKLRVLVSIHHPVLFPGQFDELLCLWRFQTQKRVAPGEPHLLLYHRGWTALHLTLAQLILRCNWLPCSVGDSRLRDRRWFKCQEVLTLKYVHLRMGHNL